MLESYLPKMLRNSVRIFFKKKAQFDDVGFDPWFANAAQDIRHFRGLSTIRQKSFQHNYYDDKNNKHKNSPPLTATISQQNL